MDVGKLILKHDHCSLQFFIICLCRKNSPSENPAFRGSSFPKLEKWEKIASSSLVITPSTLGSEHNSDGDASSLSARRAPPLGVLQPSGPTHRCWGWGQWTSVRATFSMKLHPKPVSRKFQRTAGKTGGHRLAPLPSSSS